MLGAPPRAVQLLEQSANRQREVGDVLYDDYRTHRFRLIEHLQHKHGKTLETAIHIAQKLLDRIVFVAFCEDRGLLPRKCIDTAYRNLPPFTKVTNPRWRNFVDLFRAIDQGHATLELEPGYNGGLFRRDGEVDDLQLDDEWTRFFQGIGLYDFQDEVNVDVLGHLFEKLVGELEAIRQGGLYGLGPSSDQVRPGKGQSARSKRADAPVSVMPKSAERKRYGVYYTPPAFTEFLVRETVSAVVERRLDKLREAHGLESAPFDTPFDTPFDADQPSPGLAAYWREALAVLRDV
ncbi:MAG TPA: hypothetical protein VGX76_05750, partial [Pirellulales bacterium]|nr:hypothetical protein [Pirellulales bacterium]